jgi:hypothetical protein
VPDNDTVYDHRQVHSDFWEEANNKMKKSKRVPVHRAKEMWLLLCKRENDVGRVAEVAWLKHSEGWIAQGWVPSIADARLAPAGGSA